MLFFLSQRLLTDTDMAFDLNPRCFHWSIYSKTNSNIKSKLMSDMWTLLASLSHRGPEFWPGSRHRDWCLAGSGHRHRCGDCCGEEDGQILVSTSTLLVESRLKADSYIKVVQ